MKALLRDAMPELLTVSTPTTEAEKLATKVDVAAKGLTVAGRVHDLNMYTSRNQLIETSYIIKT